MILPVLSLLAAANAEDPVVRDGRCTYSQAVVEGRGDTVLAECNRLAITSGDSPSLDFSDRTWGSRMRFSGTWAGSRFTVTGFSLRGGDTQPATGTCETYDRGGTLDTVSCLAKSGGRYYAANFVVSRL